LGESPTEVDESLQISDVPESAESMDVLESHGYSGTHKIQSEFQVVKVSEATELSDDQKTSDVSELQDDQESPTANEIQPEPEVLEFSLSVESAEAQGLTEAAEVVDANKDRGTVLAQDARVESEVLNNSEVQEVQESIIAEESEWVSASVPEMPEVKHVDDTVADSGIANKVSTDSVTDEPEEDLTVEGGPQPVSGDSTNGVSEQIDFDNHELPAVDLDLFASESILPSAENASANADVSFHLDIVLTDSHSEDHPSDERFIDAEEDGLEEVENREQLSTTLAESAIVSPVPDSRLSVVDQDGIADVSEPMIPDAEEPVRQGFVKRWAKRIVSWVKRFVGF